MANTDLSVCLVKDPTGTPERYYLKVEDYTWGQSRPVINTALPGGEVFQLDMGRTTQVFQFIGTCEYERDTDSHTGHLGSGYIADRIDMLKFKNWWDETLRLYLDDLNYLEGKISRVDVKRTSVHTHCNFTMEFTIQKAYTYYSGSWHEDTSWT